MPSVANPLASVRFLEWDRLLARSSALRDAILARERAGGGRTVSNVGGWHSEPDLTTWPGEAVACLVRQLHELAQEIDASRAWGVEAWANVLRRGDYHEPHVHHPDAWSGVYYVEAGDAGGELVLLWRQEERLIRPRSGLAVVFPGRVWHRVEPHAAESPRISIAFNFYDRRRASANHSLGEERDSRRARTRSDTGAARPPETAASSSPPGR